MSKRNGSGLAALIAGVAAGAAAVFLSKKENREKTKKVLRTAEKKIVKVSKEVKKDPKKFAKKVERKGKVLAKKAVKEAAKDIKKIEVQAVVAEKKLVKKAKSSPALKAVGKTISKKLSKKA